MPIISVAGRAAEAAKGCRVQEFIPRRLYGLGSFMPYVEKQLCVHRATNSHLALQPACSLALPWPARATVKMERMQEQSACGPERDGLACCPPLRSSRHLGFLAGERL